MFDIKQKALVTQRTSSLVAQTMRQLCVLSAKHSDVRGSIHENQCHIVGFGICVFLCAASIAFAQATQGATNFNASNSSQVVNVTQSGAGFGLKVTTSSTGPVGAIFGQATGTSGFNNGVWGRSFSPGGVAVRGENFATSGTATGGAFFSHPPFGLGVYGASTATTGNGMGIHGFAQSPSGIGVLGDVASSCDTSCSAGDPIGVLGRISSTASEGAAGVFEQDFPDGGGNIIIGRVVQSGVTHFVNVFRVDSAGTVFANGGINTSGADFAESFAVEGSRSGYTAGDVLVIDRSSKRRLTRTAIPYSTLVAGIYSTKPGVLASPYKMDETPRSKVPLAVVGVVPCKVTAKNGAIHAGDLLVTSSREGYAMKGTNRNKMVGAVLGKALEPLAKGTD